MEAIWLLIIVIAFAVGYLVGDYREWKIWVTASQKNTYLYRGDTIYWVREIKKDELM